MAKAKVEELPVKPEKTGNNHLEATVTVEGTRPLFWHHFRPDSIPLEKGEKTGVAGNDPESWKKTVLITEDRQLYLNPDQIFRMVRGGGSHIRKSRGSIMTDIESTLQVLDNVILVDRFLPEGTPPTDPKQPVYLDIRSVKNPSTKARNVCYRIVAAAGWHVTFRFFWDKTVVSRGQMEAALRDAGMFEGLGNARKIGMGRFRVLSFDVKEHISSFSSAA